MTRWMILLLVPLLMGQTWAKTDCANSPLAIEGFPVTKFVCQEGDTDPPSAVKLFTMEQFDEGRYARLYRVKAPVVLWDKPEHEVIRGVDLALKDWVWDMGNPAQAWNGTWVCFIHKSEKAPNAWGYGINDFVEYCENRIRPFTGKEIEKVLNSVIEWK